MPVTYETYRRDHHCPKCNLKDISDSYHENSSHCKKLPGSSGQSFIDEHIHRTCRRCQFEWPEAPIDDSAVKPRMALTIKELRDFLDQYDLDDNALVYYQRIEDDYFYVGGGWKENLVLKDSEDGMADEYIKVRACVKFHNDGNLYLTAHY